MNLKKNYKILYYFKAGQNGNVQVAQHLINAKVDLNIQDNMGFTALVYGK
jgi:hypothetical protein